MKKKIGTVPSQGIIDKNFKRSTKISEKTLNKTEFYPKLRQSGPKHYKLSKNYEPSFENYQINWQKQH